MLNIIKKIKMDYFTKDLMPQYDELISLARNEGYKIVTFRDACLLKDEYKTGPDKYLIIRHDIDTAVYRAEDFLKIEKSYGCVGTYYFRLGMLDIPLMKEIEFAGGEATYHFEEIASYAKEHHLYTREDIIPCLDIIREMFKENLTQLRQKTSLPMVTVAAHGDFANVKLKMSNYELLTNDLRRELRIIGEAYDSNIKCRNNYISDVAYGPGGWNSKYLKDAIIRGDKRIYFLTHPRAWGACWLSNTYANFIRVYEGIRY
ncbi:hypothetical protein [Cloacibacillus porcorum]|uniref:hypothetical protein n=1 Tax=Cloacibacillus porcorum TaxID=1197717 RepID=UPI002671379B|nr:hypothetical protein [Cloacibacillus porcorum]